MTAWTRPLPPGSRRSDAAPSLTMPTVEMTFTPLPAHVRTARLVATAVARRSGVPEALLDEVRPVVAEPCFRAVGLHRELCLAERVKFALTGLGGGFEVVVTTPAASDGGMEWPSQPATDGQDPAALPA